MGIKVQMALSKTNFAKARPWASGENMRDDFDDIRAERDRPVRSGGTSHTNPHAGLWKQIALGIVVGWAVIAVLSVLGWTVFGHLAFGTLTFGAP